MKRLLLASVCSLAAFPALAASMSAQDFVNKAAVSGMYEVQSSQIVTGTDGGMTTGAAKNMKGASTASTMDAKMDAKAGATTGTDANAQTTARMDPKTGAAMNGQPTVAAMSGTQAGTNAGTNAGTMATTTTTAANKPAGAAMQTGATASSDMVGPEIASFAQEMIADHTKANDELAQIAKGENLQVPTALDQPHQQMIKALQDAKGEQLSATYIQQQIKAHQDAVALFEDYSQSGDNAQLAAFAEKTLPVLQEHLQHAQMLESQGGYMATGSVSGSANSGTLVPAEAGKNGAAQGNAANMNARPSGQGAATQTTVPVTKAQ